MPGIYRGRPNGLVGYRRHRRDPLCDHQRMPARLAALVERLRRSGSAYWTNKLAGVGEVNSIEDLPFTDKDEFRQHYPFGMLAVPMRDVVRLHASSGTSGKPTIVAYTAADIDVFAEINARA